MQGWKGLLLLGAVLIAAIVVWRLFSASYTSDVRNMCEAESRSGVTMKVDHAKVTNWMKANVNTAEGIALLDDVTKKRHGEAADQLRGEAKKIGYDSCRLADSLKELQETGDYLADVVRLCNGLDLPNLETQDDDGRMKRIQEWIDKSAQSSKTKALGRDLAALAPPDRAKKLRDEGAANGAYKCDTADKLEMKKVAPTMTGPQVHLQRPQINGALKEEDFRKVIDAAMPKITLCYTDGLNRKPDLQGRMLLKFSLSAEGKVNGATDAGGMFPDAMVVGCVSKVLEGLKFPPQSGPMTTVFDAIDFTPNL